MLNNSLKLNVYLLWFQMLITVFFDITLIYIYYCIVYLNNSKVCIFCDVLHWCCFLCVYYKYIFHIFCQILKPNISPTHLTFIDFSLTCLRLIFKHPHQPSKMKWCGLKVTWSQCEFQILHFPRLVRTFIGKYLRPFPWTCSYIYTMEEYLNCRDITRVLTL